MMAQESKVPQRTPADIAHKQTEMLIRELDIQDTVLQDTLFNLHLKYAQLCHQPITRSEALQSMQMLIEELKNLLSPEQYERLMSRQINGTPRSPQPCKWIGPAQRGHGELPPPPPGAPDMPPPPLENQPADLQ